MKLSAGNFGDCLERIAEKGKVTAGQALEILSQVSDRAEQMRQTGVKDPHVAAAGELADKIAEAAKKDRLDALRNATIRNAIMQRIDDAGGIGKAELTLRSLLHGTNAGDRQSIESLWRGVAAGWQGVLGNEIRKAGIEKAAISGDIDQALARELWELNNGEMPFAAERTPVRAAAEAINQALDHARDRLNAAGAEIGDGVDYVAHTSHDPAKMRRAAGPGASVDQAFAAWWKATEPRLADKTFEGLTPRDGESAGQARQRFARSVYEALVSGIHLTPDGAFGLKTGEDGYVPKAYEGTTNLARKLSQDRVLYWRDADAWLGHMQEFGTPSSLTDGVMRTLDRSARQLALMEQLGTNPTGNFNTIIRRLQERYRSDLDGIDRFKSKITGLEAVMAHLDGRANLPANEMAAKIGASIRTLETTGSLGGVGVTHFASIWPTVTSEMVHHGVSRLETLGNMVQALVKGAGSEERREVLAQLGAYSAGLTRDMFARFQPEDGVPGRLSAMANTFMKYTGIHYIFDNTQAAVREMLANQLARSGDLEHGALDPHLQQMLVKYGIGPAEWDLLRRVGDLPTAEGRAYLTPDSASRIDPAAAEAYLRAGGRLEEGASGKAIAREIAGLKNELSDKLLSYYGDAAAHSVVTSGVRERAAVLGQERPGSFGGELRRFLLQFKMWPLAAMNQIIGREIYMSLNKGEAAWNIGILAALSMAGGYLRMSVNDAALGHPIRNPLELKTMAAALAQGGGIGILGDFLFGEANRFGGGLVGTLGGPVVGDVDQLVQLFNKWKNKEAGWPDMAHMLVRHVPFANLVYLKGALDYLLWYHLYEAASPGWWERTNRRLLKEQGRTMTGYQPGRGVPWTPFGLGGQS